MDKDFLRQLIQDVKENGFAKRELGEILNAFGHQRRGGDIKGKIAESLRKHGLNVVSFEDTKTTKKTFTVYGSRYINYKGNEPDYVGNILEEFHPSVSPVCDDDVCSDVLERFNDVLTDHLPVIDRKTGGVVGYVSETRLLKKKNRNSSVKSSIVQFESTRPDYSVFDLTQYINVHGFVIVEHYRENRFFMLSALEWLQVLYKLRLR